MMIGMALFWLAVIVALIWLLGEAAGRWNRRPDETPPLTILDRRFAEGALSLDEYRERRHVLTGAGASRPEDARSRTAERSDR